MKGVLFKMQSTVKQYAKVLSEVLGVDVEIVDKQLNRVAGTGIFREKINRNMAEEGYVYRTVIDTGTMQIISAPGEDKLCQDCPKSDNCDETFEMSTPIKVKDEIIGIIGFVCFAEQQRAHIMDNYTVFINFLNHIAELIASKALEEIEKEKTLSILTLLNEIIDKVDQGIMILDGDNKMVKMNSKAAYILNLNHTNFTNMKIHVTSKEKDTSKHIVYRMRINNTSYDLVGKEYKIHLEQGQFHKAFVFDDVNALKEKAMALTHVRENVGLDKILGKSQVIYDLKEQIKKVAQASSTVLITGESGTGKELFSRAIHEEGSRSAQPFVALNCAAIPDTLLESELFGYTKGAFTGADPKGKIGKIELAHKGTLFLDEIGDMPLYLQAKLLRVLEQRQIIPLGSNRPIDVDVRIIAATNKNLEKMIENKTFRKDLFYRLNVIPIPILPLRERREDIKTLAIYFINKYARLFNKTITKIEQDVWVELTHYDWPGNVRELQNTVEYMINMVEHRGVLTCSLLPDKVLKPIEKPAFEPILSLQEIEKTYIIKALDTFGRDVKGKKAAAKKLGLGMATLYRKINKYGIQ